MNILFISNDPSIFLETSATRARMRAYAKALTERGGELHILSRSSHTQTITEGDLSLYGLDCSRILAPIRLASYARRILREKDIAVVSAQDPFEYGLVALMSTRGTTTKLHIQIHTDFLSPWFTRGGVFRSPQVRMPFLNRLRIYIAGRILPKAHGVRVVSSRIKSSLEARYASTVVTATVIPIHVSSEILEAKELPPHPFTFALLAVGRLEPEKRIEDIIAAIARLHDAYPSLGVLIAGEGRERSRLERMVRSLGLVQNVIFLGHRSDARALMASAQGFIQASAYEGYGITLVEAALAGVPIVASDVGIVGEVFVGYEHVLCAPVGDPTNLAAHIAWLIEDTQARKVLGMNARARALQHLREVQNSPEDIISDILKTLSV